MFCLYSTFLRTDTIFIAQKTTQSFYNFERDTNKIMSYLWEEDF